MEAGVKMGRGARVLQGNGRRRILVGLAIAAALACTACAHGRQSHDAEINVFPASYKADIVAAMHAYLNDPTGIRDAAVSEPAVKSIGGLDRYAVCLRFNARKAANTYAGVKEIAAVFIAGRFDRFVESAHEPCAGASYTPFPELGRLSR
jgi:hypothetical protein